MNKDKSKARNSRRDFLKNSAVALALRSQRDLEKSRQCTPPGVLKSELGSSAVAAVGAVRPIRC